MLEEIVAVSASTCPPLQTGAASHPVSEIIPCPLTHVTVRLRLHHNRRPLLVLVRVLSAFCVLLQVGREGASVYGKKRERERARESPQAYECARGKPQTRTIVPWHQKPAATVPSLRIILITLQQAIHYRLFRLIRRSGCLFRPHAPSRRTRRVLPSSLLCLLVRR